MTTLHSRWTAVVLEPDRARAAMVTDHLRELGCADATVVRTSEAALAQLEVRAPRILIVAARMQGDDGFAFTRRLRRAPGLRSNEVSTVLTFSGVSQNDMAAALNAGADAILTFPMSRSQLGAMLQLLDTQKRRFVRGASYVGPCRRRGLVGSDGDFERRRLEDYGAPEALRQLLDTLKALFAQARKGPVAPEALQSASATLADYLRAARPDRQIDEKALTAQCDALVRQYATHAPAARSFDHAFAPLRKLLTNVVLPDVKRAA